MHRRLRIGVIVLGGLVVAGATALLGPPAAARWMVAHRVIPRVEKQLGRRVAYDRIAIDRGRVRIEGLVVRGPADAPGAPFVRAGAVTARFDPWQILLGHVRLGEVVVERPEVCLFRDENGGDNWGDLLERLRRRRGGGDGPGARRGPTRVVVRRGSLSVEDRRHGLRLQVASLDSDVKRRGPITVALGGVAAASDLGPHAAADRLVLTGNLVDLEGTASVDVSGGRVSLWPAMSLTGIAGQIGAAGEPGRAGISLTGGYGGVEGSLWHAEGWLDPRRRAADVHLRADRFTLDKLAPILAGSPVQDPGATSLETSLDLALRNGVVTFAGSIALAGLTLYHPWLADEPVRDLSFRSSVRGRFATRERVATIDSLEVETRGVSARVEGFAALPGGELADGGGVRRRPHVAAHLLLPPVPCQRMLDAMPPELTPRLAGFRLAGRFDADLTVDIDWADLDNVVLDGSVGIAGCRVLRAPDSAARIQGEFEHEVEIEQDRWVKFTIGPSNPDFVPFAAVSPYVIKSFMTTEDSAFYQHRGFVVREFRSALVRNLKEGYFKYGASSITMQLVKNVLLYREKTLARKLQELFLTWWVEQTLEKDRILEIYVNAIEFGPGLYGIGPAARHYFGKSASDLNPVEAAFFSSILPNPKQRHLQYCENQLSRWGDDKVKRILRIMHERARLTDEEYAAAQQTPLIFDRTEAGTPQECAQRTRKIMKNARPTTPPRRGSTSVPARREPQGRRMGRER